MIALLLGWLRKVPIWAWLALGAAGVIGWQHIEIGHYKAKIATVQAQSAAYVAAQKSQLATITALQLANRGWAAKYKKDMALGKTYTDAAMRYARQQQAAADASSHKLRVIYDNVPAARQWAAAAPPAAVVQQLRDNAGSSH